MYLNTKHLCSEYFDTLFSNILMQVTKNMHDNPTVLSEGVHLQAYWLFGQWMFRLPQHFKFLFFVRLVGYLLFG